MMSMVVSKILPLRLAKDLDFVILAEPFPPNIVMPLRSEFRWDSERREPTDAGLAAPEAGTPSPGPVTPPRMRLAMVELRYDISVAISML